MAQFASLSEFGDFIGESVDLEDARSLLLLKLASAACQAYTGQTLELVEDDEVDLPGVWASELELPERPVVDVSAVTENGVESAFTLASGGRLLFGLVTDGLWDSDPYGSWGGPAATVHITYSHGFEVIPDAIKLATLMIAARLRSNPDNPTPLEGETIGSYSYKAAAQSLVGELLGPEKSLLRRYRRTTHSVRT